MAPFDTTRAFIEIAGEEREHFLQGIVTQDVALLTENNLLFGALLTPPGKLAHDFFLLKRGGTILLDTPLAGKDMLVKRLAMYKLRAKVTIRDVSDPWKVGYAPAGGLADPRHAEMPHRIYHQPAGTMAVDEYHDRRIALGVPDSAFDTTPDDVAMDLGYDLLNAINFSKGCYVGQEVTARMHYKQIARRGFYIVESQGDLPASGTTVKAGELTVGTLRGVHGNKGLALLKFGEVAHAAAHNIPLTVDNRPLRAAPPAWMAPKLALFQAAHNNQ